MQICILLLPPYFAEGAALPRGERAAIVAHIRNSSGLAARLLYIFLVFLRQQVKSKSTPGGGIPGIDWANPR